MDILQIVMSNVPATQSVAYTCVLTNLWSGATHPIDYSNISGVAHWSPPVLAAHSNNYELWAPGRLASPGVEAVAETGVTSILQQEISLFQSKGKAGEFVVGRDQFNARDPPQVFEDISMSPNYPYMSSISMLAPSPDWFSGFYNFSPIDVTQQFWYRSFEIATYPWDAGTEQGETYSINNAAEPMHDPIFRLTKDTVPDSGILLDPTGIEVLPVALWNCVINTQPQPPVAQPQPPVNVLAPPEDPTVAMPPSSGGSTGPLNEKKAKNRAAGASSKKQLKGGVRGLSEEAPMEAIHSNNNKAALEETASNAATSAGLRGASELHN